MKREEKENLLREAVDILIKLDNHLMTSRDNAEFSSWVEDLIDNNRFEVLDKIRAEIKQLPYQRIFGNVSSYSLLDTVVEIIDKYKAESEDAKDETID